MHLLHQHSKSGILDPQKALHEDYICCTRPVPRPIPTLGFADASIVLLKAPNCNICHSFLKFSYQIVYANILYSSGTKNYHPIKRGAGAHLCNSRF